MNIINKDHLYSIIEKFDRLPGKIDSLSKEAFESVYGSLAASKARNIIYFFISAKPVPRLHGFSNILYIGQTRHSFKVRYLKYAGFHASSTANSLKFKTIIEKYGPIEIAYCDYRTFGETLLDAEGQFLWWYFQNHCEYPPINYSKTNIRNDSVMARTNNQADAV